MLILTIFSPVAWEGGLDDGIFRGFLAPGCLVEGVEGAVGPQPLDLRSERRKIIDKCNRLGQTAVGDDRKRNGGNVRLWCAVVGGSGAGPIGGVEVGARMGAEATQLAGTIGWLPANLGHRMASDRPSFALVFEGKVSFSRFLFPPTWY